LVGDAGPYGASKAAVISLTRSDAIDYARDGIRVNCVCPGVIETPMTVSDEESRSKLEPYVQMAAVGRMGQPGEIADAVLFLCSARASFVHGHAMVVDGGYILT
jgi:NAD(P)-dependent dehydrogenase (short-subunit alcohol dehydrogenase family)